MISLTSPCDSNYPGKSASRTVRETHRGQCPMAPGLPFPPLGHPRQRTPLSPIRGWASLTHPCFPWVVQSWLSPSPPLPTLGELGQTATVLISGTPASQPPPLISLDRSAKALGHHSNVTISKPSPGKALDPARK